MGNTRKYDEETVLRARVLLLGSGRLNWWQEVEAYRVLATVSPAAYLPKLVRALTSYRNASWRTADPEVELALHAEAVEAARRIGTDEPNRADVLCGTLRSYQRSLFAAGRRAEGRAVCEELAEAGRYGRLAVVLAEEGRHGEAAELLGRHIAAGEADVSDWTLIEWAAELDAAGRHEKALEVFARLVEDHRRRAAEDLSPLVSLVWKLEQHARMLRAAGRLAEEAAARREALALLVRLARGGEPVSWSGIEASWVTLLALSGRPAEPAATPDAPLPAFGVHLLHDWSPDVRKDYFASIPALERQTAALRESGDLSGLIVTQRRLTVRRALRWESRRRGDVETLLPAFDEGVALARRLATDPDALARALTDRSMFLLAVQRYEEAHADFAEAIALQPIVTRT
ncbi:hypothetical protein [Streptomyces globisporus]|uniref:hypothetical protein n=1 Tax=Streptomyces globisporus TaxID=1908 RepID=UPI00055EF765|nr:hypothetical protein [Streptomyces globisporus]